MLEIMFIKHKTQYFVLDYNIFKGFLFIYYNMQLDE